MKLLNVIPLGKTNSDYINPMITITGDVQLVEPVVFTECGVEI